MIQTISKAHAKILLFAAAAVAVAVLSIDHSISSILRMAAAVVMAFSVVLYSYVQGRPGALSIPVLGFVLSAIMYVTGTFLP